MGQAVMIFTNSEYEANPLDTIGVKAEVMIDYLGNEFTISNIISYGNIPFNIFLQNLDYTGKEQAYIDAVQVWGENRASTTDIEKLNFIANNIDNVYLAIATPLVAGSIFDSTAFTPISGTIYRYVISPL